MSTQPTSAVVVERSWIARLRWLAGQRALWPFVALALILAFNGIISPGFFNVRIVEGRPFGNVIDILYRATPTALVALGMAIVIGTKGIDLSVGAIIAIVGATMAWRIQAGDPHVVVLLFALGTGLLCGLWNGFLVAVSGGVGQQAGDHIGPGGGSPFGDQFPHDLHEGTLGPHGTFSAVDHVGHERGHVITTPIVQTVEPAEDKSRQASGVGGTQIGAGGAAEGVDETVRHPGAHHTQFVEVDR